MSTDNVAEDPLYTQIARALKDEITRGDYPVGARMPTEEELCRRFDVSRYTVRGAIGILRDDGLVASRRGAGTVVTPPPAMSLRNFGAMSVDELLHFATGSYIDIQSIRVAKIDKQQAARTQLPKGEEWLMVRAIGYETGTDSSAPLGVAEYFINREFAGVGRLLESHRAPIFPLIEDMYGVYIAEVHQVISARLVEGALAAELEVEDRSPALEVRHTYRLADGKIAQLAINTHPSDRYRHTVTMHRVKAGAR